MSLVEKIKSIYPELENDDFVNTIQVVNEGKTNDEDYIYVWNHPTLTKPTQAELDAVTE